jgi:hypothetical protein
MSQVPHPPPVEIDPVSVAVALMGTAIGAELARYVGPYLVIAAAGFACSGFAVMRRESVSRLRSLGFMCWMTAISLLATVSLAELLVSLLPGVQVRWMLVPVAGGIAAIGHDWPRVGQWIVDRLARLIERRAGTAGPGQQE